jgi:hypothetical protein
MKAVTCAGAVLGMVLMAPACFAQQPQAQPTSLPPSCASSYTTPAPIHGGFDAGHCGGIISGECCDDGCGWWKSPGYLKQCYCKFKARMQACFSQHQQVQSPVFRTHPFARSPRDYFMYD